MENITDIGSGGSHVTAFTMFTLLPAPQDGCYAPCHACRCPCHAMLTLPRTMLPRRRAHAITTRCAIRVCLKMSARECHALMLLYVRAPCQRLRARLRATRMRNFTPPRAPCRRSDALCVRMRRFCHACCHALICAAPRATRHSRAAAIATIRPYAHARCLFLLDAIALFTVRCHVCRCLHLFAMPLCLVSPMLRRLRH